MNVREATPDDAPGIAAVHVASWNAAYRGVIADEALDALTEEGLTREWRAGIERPDPPAATVAVLETGGRVDGYARFGPSRDDDLDPSDSAEIYGFYLHPGRWGRGGGRALMEHVLSDLGGRGFRTVVLWVVQVNDRAQGFYRALGFAPDGRDDKLCIGAPEFRYRRELRTRGPHPAALQ
ncbi:MAG TPA: GNAT family N-acetyltransferase [Actinomycetota bacterium]|nr:GNAT family N-acetyltransferase [Actinomycetota bacterium]